MILATSYILAALEIAQGPPAVLQFSRNDAAVPPLLCDRVDADASGLFSDGELRCDRIIVALRQSLIPSHLRVCMHAAAVLRPPTRERLDLWVRGRHRG